MRLLMYYNLMAMTVMVILNACSSLKEKQDDRYDQGYVHDTRKMCLPLEQQGRAHATFGISTWNLSEHDSMVA
jgi:hypothetical protein